jgi:16S rRNA A1518/A1519 N6-dimethyltransferase RsmA/KsgA/DIM1 with predicted DNA glycosylase/AP lyase activity
VVLQYLFLVRILRRVGPASFHPRPQVESAWVRFLPRENADIDLALSWIEPLAKAAFSHRRKKTSANLSGASVGEIRLTKKQVQDCLRAVGAGDDCRAEELSPAQYASLARAIRQLNRDLTSNH